jgi:hypothetical protein
VPLRFCGGFAGVLPAGWQKLPGVTAEIAGSIVQNQKSENKKQK